MHYSATADREFKTPMMKQYLELKAEYPDCILFYRLGDFYELFLDDAELGAQILGITLTRRSRGKDGRIPMCGVPYHAVDLYLPKLVNAGHKVAIAEQITSPKDTPNLVIRKVVRIVTAGTMIDGRTVDERESSHVCAIEISGQKVWLALADLATGNFLVKEASIEKLGETIHQFLPKEIILSPTTYNNAKQLSLVTAATPLSSTNIAPFLDWELWQQNATNHLKQHFQVSSLRAFDLKTDSEIGIASVLLGYLSYTQQGRIGHIKSINKIYDQQYLALDATTIDSLELFTSTMDRTTEGSLFKIINQTQTAMGNRMLKDWTTRPLAQLQPIQDRHHDVDLFVQNPGLTQKLRDLLQQVVDIERLMARLAVGIGNARDLVALKTSLQICEQVVTAAQAENLQTLDLEKVAGITKNLTTDIDRIILDDPKGITREGGMIKPGVDEQLDELQQTFADTTSWLTKFEQQERARTGISTLKVAENSVFGFYIEVSKAHTHTIKDEYGYERKQTLVNAERYITHELKQKEQIALTAREAIFAREFDIFSQLVDQLVQESETIYDMSRVIAQLDCLTGLAQLALENNYVKPTMTSDKVLAIKNGRHPVVENFLGTDFVPNSTDMTVSDRCMLLTGPNMAGKSTYIRQVALIVIMAHLGSFVPADHGIIPLCDRVFSRIGASDALHKGLSTFMVEMTETARILHHLTDKSLVIFDEVGRGTSTTDGMSLAQAIAEHVATLPTQPFIFFATHYHELARLADSYSTVKNYSMAVKIHKGKMIFLRTIQPGSSDESYGIEVAKQAGIPVSIIRRAEEVKTELEKNIRAEKLSTEQIDDNPTEKYRQVLDELIKLDIDDLSPKQAWEKITKLQFKLQDVA